MDKEFNAALKIHGILDDEEDSDSGREYSETELAELEAMRPPPIDYDPSMIVVIKPKPEAEPAFRNRKSSFRQNRNKKVIPKQGVSMQNYYALLGEGLEDSDVNQEAREKQEHSRPSIGQENVEALQKMDNKTDFFKNHMDKNICSTVKSHSTNTSAPLKFEAENKLDSSKIQRKRRKRKKGVANREQEIILPVLIAPETSPITSFTNSDIFDNTLNKGAHFVSDDKFITISDDPSEKHFLGEASAFPCSIHLDKNLDNISTHNIQPSTVNLQTCATCVLEKKNINSMDESLEGISWDVISKDNIHQPYIVIDSEYENIVHRKEKPTKKIPSENKPKDSIVDKFLKGFDSVRCRNVAVVLFSVFILYKLFTRYKLRIPFSR